MEHFFRSFCNMLGIFVFSGPIRTYKSLIFMDHFFPLSQEYSIHSVVASGDEKENASRAERIQL